MGRLRFITEGFIKLKTTDLHQPMSSFMKHFHFVTGRKKKIKIKIRLDR